MSMLPPFFDPHTPAGLSALNAEITRQATMVAYVDDFKLMLLLTIAVAPLLIFMRKPKGNARPDPAHAAVE
jgi:DHA2 family multidrug resistance protein